VLDDWDEPVAVLCDCVAGDVALVDATLVDAGLTVGFTAGTAGMTKCCHTVQTIAWGGASAPSRQENLAPVGSDWFTQATPERPVLRVDRE